MLRVESPKDRKKLEQQIAALKYQISADTNETDREIHEYALRELEKAYTNNPVNHLREGGRNE